MCGHRKRKLVFLFSQCKKLYTKSFYFWLDRDILRLKKNDNKQVNLKFQVFACET